LVEIRKLVEGLSAFGRKNDAGRPKQPRASIQTSLLSFKDFCSAAEIRANGVIMSGECSPGVGFHELP